MVSGTHETHTEQINLYRSRSNSSKMSNNKTEQPQTNQKYIWIWHWDCVIAGPDVSNNNKPEVVYV